MLGNHKYCYPLTISDYRSRYLIACEGVKSTKSDFAFTVFERAFKDFGLPQAIRTDNGVPFASGNALFGLTRLAVWWLRLGINLQRIKPGHPEQNGRHERMHLTLKQEATKPAAFNFLQQQERFDDFIGVYNNERPHQALGGAYPGDLYTPSARIYEPEVLRLVVVEVAVDPVLVGGIALDGPALRTEGRECRSGFAVNGRTIQRKLCGLLLPMRRISAIISASNAENRRALFVGTGWLAGADLG
jgi:hypothetical protein